MSNYTILTDCIINYIDKYDLTIKDNTKMDKEYIEGELLYQEKL